MVVSACTVWLSNWGCCVRDSREKQRLRVVWVSGLLFFSASGSPGEPQAEVLKGHSLSWISEGHKQRSLGDLQSQISRAWWDTESALQHDAQCLEQKVLSSGHRLCSPLCSWDSSALWSFGWFHLVAGKGFLLPGQIPYFISHLPKICHQSGWLRLYPFQGSNVLYLCVEKGTKQCFKWRRALPHAGMLSLLLLYSHFPHSSCFPLPFVLELNSRWMARRALLK